MVQYLLEEKKYVAAGGLDGGDRVERGSNVVLIDPDTC